jgi:hypothetical protein
MKRAGLAAIGAAMAIILAAPAHADPDTDFANQLHTYGIYGPKDYNAWLGKIVCKRLGVGLDPDAYKSAGFILTNLPQHSTTAQAYQFLGASISTYCPELTSVLQNISLSSPAQQPNAAGQGPYAAEQH